VVAARLGCSVKHVYDLAAEGAIPAFHVGRLLRFSLERVFEALSES